MHTTTDVTRARVGAQFDKRRRISADDKKQVHTLFAKGHSIRAIERQLKGRVSRRSIQFILFPERLTRHKKVMKKTPRTYDATKQRAYTAKYRAHKKTLLKKHLIA